MVHKAEVIGKNINLVPVTEGDAEFILSLRLNEELGKHLNKTENNVEKQRNWLRQSIPKEDEWYFVVTDKAGNKIGTIRIYDVIDAGEVYERHKDLQNCEGSFKSEARQKSFSWGSWIIMPQARSYGSFESAILIYRYAFEVLGFEYCHFDVRKANQKVIDFHLRFGAKIISEDEDNYYFTFHKDDFTCKLSEYLIKIDQITNKLYNDD